MSRKIITKEELKDILNERLHKAIGNDSISFGGTTLLAESDTDGSNWSTAIVMQGRNEDVYFYGSVIETVRMKVRQEFNIIE